MMKFERGKDIKDILKLGVFQKREFADDYVAMDFLVKVMPFILAQDDGKEPKVKMELYVMKYIRVNDGGFFPEDQMANPSLMFLVNATLMGSPCKEEWRI